MSSMHTGPASLLPADVIIDIATCLVPASPDLYRDARRLFRYGYYNALFGDWDTSFEGTMVIPEVGFAIRQRLGLLKPDDVRWQ